MLAPILLGLVTIAPSGSSHCKVVSSDLPPGVELQAHALAACSDAMGDDDEQHEGEQEGEQEEEEQEEEEGRGGERAGHGWRLRLPSSTGQLLWRAGSGQVPKRQALVQRAGGAWRLAGHGATTRAFSLRSRQRSPLRPDRTKQSARPPRSAWIRQAPRWHAALVAKTYSQPQGPIPPGGLSCPVLSCHGPGTGMAGWQCRDDSLGVAVEHETRGSRR